MPWPVPFPLKIVHSSTSSFSRHVPDVSFMRHWPAGIAVGLLLLGVAEYGFRAQGHLPDVTDDMDLWSYERSRVYEENGRKKIVLLGASRIQLGVDPEILEERLPGYESVCLAIDGHGALAVLRDLAEDEDFNGIVLCSVTPANMFKNGQQPWVDHYHTAWASLGRVQRIVNLKCRLALQTHCAVFSYWLNLKRQLGYRFSIPLSHVLMDARRHRKGYFHDRMSASELMTRVDRRIRGNPARAPRAKVGTQDFEEGLRTKVKPLVDRIRSRGGDVCFFHMPLHPRHGERFAYPKALYWDKVAPATGAITVHSEDEATLRAFRAADASHLDATDVPAFTRAVATILKSQLSSRGTATSGVSH